MARASAVQKESMTPRPAAPRAKRTPVKSPWQRNSVRRRWTYLTFTLILVFAAALVFGKMDDLTRLGLPVLLALCGFGALPLVYLLAKRLGASRATALWAMALLGACVPWLLLLRIGTTSALIPAFITLGAWLYTRVTARLPWSWVALGVSLAALCFIHPWAGMGLALGLALHAACWVRQAPVWRTLGFAGALLALGIIGLCCIPQLRDPAWAMPTGGAAVSRFLSYLLAMNAWVLPWLALPLLWLALFADPAHRWRVNMEAALPALVLLATLLVASFSPEPMRLRMLLGIAPLAALWLAMGLARLQVRTPVWVWAPVGVMLVATALPQMAMRWGCQAIGLHRAVPDRALAQELAPPRAGMLVPLYPYITSDRAVGTVPMEDI
jgi:4-amino-4-deoxy-L-arabinose transferase-like glycosyltransferase